MVTTIYLNGGYCDKAEIFVSAESLMALFTLQCCEDLNIKIVFTLLKRHVPLNNLKLQYFRIDPNDIVYEYNVLDNENIPEIVQNCLLPAVISGKEPWVVSGLSSCLRHILEVADSTDSNNFSTQLLGFRKGCLQACAEVSVWTKFCEIEAVEMLNEIYFNLKTDTELSIPVNFIRYEYHMQRPPILHNALKRKQENLEKIVEDKTTIPSLRKKKLKELPDLEHKYAEGIDFTLADVLLYGCFSLCVHHLSNVIEMKKWCPLVDKWLCRLNDIDCISKTKKFFSCINADFPPIPSVPYLRINYPEVSDESLYKSDPNRYKPRWRSFTHQEDIDNILDILQNALVRKMSVVRFKQSKDGNESDKVMSLESQMQMLSIPESTEKSKVLTVSSIDFETPLKWETFPTPVNPSDGSLPLSRLKRKCQQLEFMAQVVISIAKKGDKIVDFCAGGGHLGILLAFCLPECQILLVENKKTSLNKAYERVTAQKLKNVTFYQCNLDYFDATFDIGVCLHACGVATDLVMQKCILKRAAFVCCPCCYGSLRPNHIVTYPCSSFFSIDLNVTLGNYLILGHAADQTHDENNPKTEQGKRCMEYVDYDRLLAAEETGYNTLLTVMNPPDCTPKNHVLIGSIKFLS